MKYFASILFCVCFIGHSSYTLAQCNHPDDVQALKALYHALNGDNWQWSNPTHGWDVNCTNCDLSTWTNVHCNSDGRVRDVFLHSVAVLGLDGVLPSEIGLLTEMENFLISYTPGSSSNLWVTSNIHGDLPEEFKFCTNLESLTIMSTNLTGTIPDIFDDMHALKYLDLSRNKLYGPIPDYFASSLSTSNQLNRIDLSRNQLTGGFPQNFTTAFPSSLKFLNIGYNLLSGELPNGLSNLSHLNRLEIRMNNFTGCYPDDLAYFCDKNIYADMMPPNTVEGIYDNNNFEISHFFYFCSGEEQCPEDNEPIIVTGELQFMCLDPERFKAKMGDDFQVDINGLEVTVSLPTADGRDAWFPLWGDNTSGGAGIAWDAGTYPATHTYASPGIYTICIEINNFRDFNHDDTHLCNCHTLCKEIEVEINIEDGPDDDPITAPCDISDSNMDNLLGVYCLPNNISGTKDYITIRQNSAGEYEYVRHSDIDQVYPINFDSECNPLFPVGSNTIVTIAATPTGISVTSTTYYPNDDQSQETLDFESVTCNCQKEWDAVSTYPWNYHALYEGKCYISKLAGPGLIPTNHPEKWIPCNH